MEPRRPAAPRLRSSGKPWNSTRCNTSQSIPRSGIPLGPSAGAAAAAAARRCRLHAAPSQRSVSEMRMCAMRLPPKGGPVRQVAQRGPGWRPRRRRERPGELGGRGALAAPPARRSRTQTAFWRVLARSPPAPRLPGLARPCRRREQRRGAGRGAPAHARDAQAGRGMHAGVLSTQMQRTDLTGDPHGNFSSSLSCAAPPVNGFAYDMALDMPGAEYVFGKHASASEAQHRLPDTTAADTTRLHSERAGACQHAQPRARAGAHAARARRRARQRAPVRCARRGAQRGGLQAAAGRPGGGRVRRVRSSAPCLPLCCAPRVLHSPDMHCVAGLCLAAACRASGGRSQ